MFRPAGRPSLPTAAKKAKRRLNRFGSRLPPADSAEMHFYLAFWSRLQAEQGRTDPASESAAADAALEKVLNKDLADKPLNEQIRLKGKECLIS